MQAKVLSLLPINRSNSRTPAMHHHSMTRPIFVTQVKPSMPSNNSNRTRNASTTSTTTVTTPYDVGSPACPGLVYGPLFTTSGNADAKHDYLPFSPLIPMSPDAGWVPVLGHSPPAAPLNHLVLKGCNGSGKVVEVVPPQPSPDSPVSPLTLNLRTHFNNTKKTNTNATYPKATVTASSAAILDVSTLNGGSTTKHNVTTRETAVIPRRHKVSLCTPDWFASHEQFADFHFHARSSSTETATSDWASWEELISPKTVNVGTFALAGMTEGVVDVGLPVFGAEDRGCKREKVKSLGKRSWDDYSADEQFEADDEFEDDGDEDEWSDVSDDGEETVQRSRRCWG